MDLFDLRGTTNHNEKENTLQSLYDSEYSVKYILYPCHPESEASMCLCTMHLHVGDTTY
jgi:hypothetical protein